MARGRASGDAASAHGHAGLRCGAAARARTPAARNLRLPVSLRHPPLSGPAPAVSPSGQPQHGTRWALCGLRASADDSLLLIIHTCRSYANLQTLIAHLSANALGHALAFLRRPTSPNSAFPVFIFTNTSTSTYSVYIYDVDTSSNLLTSNSLSAAYRLVVRRMGERQPPPAGGAAAAAAAADPPQRKPHFAFDPHRHGIGVHGHSAQSFAILNRNTRIPHDFRQNLRTSRWRHTRTERTTLAHTRLRLLQKSRQRSAHRKDIIAPYGWERETLHIFPAHVAAQAATSVECKMRKSRKTLSRHVAFVRFDGGSMLSELAR